MSTPGVQRGREYTVQEIAEERRYQEQCFLLYWLQYLATENKHIDYSSAFYPIDGDPETMVSVLTGKQGLGPLFNLTPYKLSFLVPKIRLYKVFKRNPDRAAEAIEYDVEFIFPDNIFGITASGHASGDPSENQPHAESMLMSKTGRGTGVGLSEFSWEYQGTNPAEATNKLLANISLRFTDLQELFVKRGPITLESHIKGGKVVEGHPKESGNDIDVNYRFVDLIMRTATEGSESGQTSVSAADEVCKQYRQWDPTYYEIKALVGWSFKSGHPFTAAEIGALEAGNIGLYLTLVDHVIGYNEDGTVDLSCTYRAAVEGMLDSDFCDLFTSPYERQRSAELDAAVRALNTGDEQDVDDGSRQLGEQGQYAQSSTSNASTQQNDEVRNRQIGLLRQEQTRLRNSARGLGYHTLARWLAANNDASEYKRTAEVYSPLAEKTGNGTFIDGSPRIRYILAKPAAVGAATDAQDVAANPSWGTSTVTAVTGQTAARYQGTNRPRKAGGASANWNAQERPEDFGQPTDLVKALRAANNTDVFTAQNGETDGSPAATNQAGFLIENNVGTTADGPDADTAPDVLKFATGTYEALSADAEANTSILADAAKDVQRSSVGEGSNAPESSEAFYAAATNRLDMNMTRPVRMTFGTDSAGASVERTVYPIAVVYYGDLLDWAVNKALWRGPFEPAKQYSASGESSTVAIASNPNAAPNSFSDPTDAAGANSDDNRQSGFTGQVLDDPAAALAEYIEQAEKTKTALDNIEIILGSLRFYDMRDGQYKTVNIADIPISYNLFATWFMNRIMRPGVYEYSLRTFIKDSLESLVLEVLAGTNCIEAPNANPPPLSRSIYDVGILNFQAPKMSANPGEEAQGPLERIWNKATVDGNFNPPGAGDDGFAAHRYNYRLNIDDIPGLAQDLGYENGIYHMNEDYIGQMSTYYVVYAKGYDVSSLRGVETVQEAEALFPGEGVKYADNSRGIYHMYIGQNSGMLKSIRFNRTDQAYLAESRMMAGGHFGYGQLRGRYEADIIMHGNTAFLPGQMIYINPTSAGSGDMSDREIDALMLGLGGYYVVLSVDSTISEDGYETRIHAVWHGMGSYYDPTANDGTGAWVVLNCGESGESRPHEVSVQQAEELATQAAALEYEAGEETLYDVDDEATGTTARGGRDELSGKLQEP